MSNRTYLDHASTSPLRPQALEAMLPWLQNIAADPGRIYEEAQSSRVAIEVARAQVAELLGATPREVIFTSGATESIASATIGAASSPDAHVVFSAVEHAAVRSASERFSHSMFGADVTGGVDVVAVREAMNANTTLVHCQFGNHEVGTLQPLREVSTMVHDTGSALVHCDASQAIGQVDVNFAALEVDLLSAGAHKFGGPQGVGVLVVKRGLRLDPLLLGGDQERARRAGMENVAAIVGFGAAAEAVRSELPAQEPRSRTFTDQLAAEATAIDGVERLGSTDNRLPHIACFGISDVEAEPVLLNLDKAGISVHSGSSCSSEALEPSPVLEAMGVDADRSLRVSVGWSTTEADVDSFVNAFPKALHDLRQLR